MKRTVALTFVVILGLIVGCSSRGPKVAKADGVLDVAPPAPAGIPAAEPAAASAAIDDTPAFAAPTPAPVRQAGLVTPAPDPLTPSPAAETLAAKKYTVKKGDTLYGIAKTQLGSGRDWQKITAANPGLTPATLRAGQKIAMP